MRITAIKQIAGDYGILAPGQSSAPEIDIPEATVQELKVKGYAKEYSEPVATETATVTVKK